MRVKICGIRNEADIEVVVKSDADAAGFLVGQLHPSPDFILPSTAARLSKHLPPYITPVIVTHLNEAEQINEIIYKTGIKTIQLHGGISLEELEKLFKLMPDSTKLIFATHVVSNRLEPDNYDDFLPMVDAMLLDSHNRVDGSVGGTGMIHNWRVSAGIVNNCPKPVILAGGLGPDNVAEAVKTVRPYAVDANSGLKAGDGSRSLEACRNFVQNAKAAALELNR